MNRIFALTVLVAALCLGACATRVENTATVSPNVALTVGAAAAPAATIVKQAVLLTPQIPQAWRTCPNVPPLLDDDATQDQHTVWSLDNRYVAKACKANVDSIDALLTKAEADARRDRK